MRLITSGRKMSRKEALLDPNCFNYFLTIDFRLYYDF